MMKSFKISSLFDFVGIALSFACLIHCLLLPFMISFLPLFMGEISEHENVHLILSLVILPVTLLAVFPGYLKHKKKKVLFSMIAGLFFIIGAVFIGHELFDETGEKLMTLAGGIVLIAGHIMNRSFCHSCPKCEDSEESKGFLSSHL